MNEWWQMEDVFYPERVSYIYSYAQQEILCRRRRVYMSML